MAQRGGERRETGDQRGCIPVDRESEGGKDPDKGRDPFMKEVKGHSGDSSTSLKCT